MKAFGLRPSRLIGDIKRMLEADIESGALAGYQPIDAYVEYIGRDKSRFGLP